MSKSGSTPRAPGTQWRDRFQYSSPWKTTHWGFGFRPINRGSDEWENPSIYIILPLIGCFVFFYGRNFRRDKWFLSGTSNRVAHYISPNYKYEAHVHFDGNFDALIDDQPLLTTDEIRVRAHQVKAIED